MFELHGPPEAGKVEEADLVALGDRATLKWCERRLAMGVKQRAGGETADALP